LKLINDIINELIDTEKSISSPLLKTKVLASRLQNEVLLNWVSNELKGYDTAGDLPDYRKYSGIITGTYINGHMQYNDQPVPTVGLKRELEKMLRSINFYQSISSLETLKGENKSGKLEQTFPAELTLFFILALVVTFKFIAPISKEIDDRAEFINYTLRKSTILLTFGYEKLSESIFLLTEEINELNRQIKLTRNYANSNFENDKKYISKY